MSQRGLGRGFDSLIPTEITNDLPAAIRPADASAMREVDPAAIHPNPHQPRTHFDDAELQGLAASIKQYGLIHPPVVSDRGDGSYELIAGERRVRAAKLAGLQRIHVIVRSYDEQQKLELAVLENVQRANLNPIETAAAYRKLADEFNFTLDQIGERMGQARSTVSNVMRLLQLPPEAQQAVASGEISEAHGRTLLAVNDPSQQAELLRQMKAGMTVRQAEAAARGLKPAKPGRRQAPPIGERAAAAASDLGGYLGTKVSVQPTAKGGRLVIEYASDDEFERIYHALKPQHHESGE